MQSSAAGRAPESGHRRTSWTDVERAVLFRIATGAYPIKARLPTCEELADELGVNKNTINKAYRSLVEHGYLRMVQGRGTFVVKRPPKAGSERALTDLHGLVALLLQEAKLAGLGHEQFLELALSTAALAYDQTRLHVGFIECNSHDAITLSRDLQEALSHPIEPILLDEVLAHPDHYFATFDILVVNLVHLQALEEVAPKGRHARPVDVIGVIVSPDAESLTQIARLRPGTRIGVAADLAPTLSTLTGVVSGYNPRAIVSSAISADDLATRKLLRDVDVVLVTPSAYPRLVAHSPRPPLIRVTLQVEERSIQQVAARLNRRAPPPS